MSALKEVLHKVLGLIAGPDHTIHADIDALPEDGSEVASNEPETAVEAPESGEEAAPNA